MDSTKLECACSMLKSSAILEYLDVARIRQPPKINEKCANTTTIEENRHEGGKTLATNKYFVAYKKSVKIPKEVQEMRLKSKEVPNVKRSEMMFKDREEGEKMKIVYVTDTANKGTTENFLEKPKYSKYKRIQPVKCMLRMKSMNADEDINNKLDKKNKRYKF